MNCSSLNPLQMIGVVSQAVISAETELFYHGAILGRGEDIWQGGVTFRRFGGRQYLGGGLVHVSLS